MPIAYDPRWALANRPNGGARRRPFREGRGRNLVIVVAGLAAIIAIATAGQAIGPVPTGMITGRTGLTVENDVVIDHDNFTVKDIGGSASDKIVAFNDDGSHFTVAAKMNTGDELVIDLPLLNTSNSDATVITTMEASEGLRVDNRVYWDTLARDSSPSPIRNCWSNAVRLSYVQRQDRVDALNWRWFMAWPFSIARKSQ